MNLPIFPIINLENRAWHGCRLAPLNNLKHPFKKDAEITFSISRHYVLDQFMVEEDYSYLRKYDFGTTKGMIRNSYREKSRFFNTIKECVEYVQSTYGIFLNILNEPVKIAYKDPELEKWE